MKYAPKKVFILENGQYTEVSYAEFISRKESNEHYKDKLFLPMHGMLMEVTKENYIEYYREKRRQKYIGECAKANGEILYDSLSTNEFNGEDILVDPQAGVDEQAEERIMKDKLTKALSLLSDDERLLVQEHFFEERSQIELSRKYGVNQSNISRRISKILFKLKKILET